MWAVGWYAHPNGGAISSLVARYHGGRWVGIDVPEVGRLDAVAALNATNAWAVGGNHMLHWNGTSWKTATLPSDVGKLDDVALISGTKHFWAVGRRTSGASLALLWNGTAWKLVTTPNIGELRAVATISGTNAWAVGVGGSLHYH